MFRISSLLLCILFSTAMGAQVKQEIFESFKLQERRDVRYYFPEDYTDDKKYPLVVVLDAEYLFDQVVAVSKFYSRFQGMPQAIIVGIHQSKDDLRWEDCAFDQETGLPTEKASRFFEFLGMEIIPYLDTSYSTAPFKIFIGFDITANFGNYFLFKERSLFDAFISISPLLAPEMPQWVPERLQALDQQIFYHLITEAGKGGDWQTVQGLHAGLQALDKENVKYTYDVYEQANAVSVASYGLGKAWDTTFDIFKPISPTEYREKILTSEEPVFSYLANKYDTIEELFGFRKKVELNDIMAIYAACRKKEDFDSLKPLAELCHEAYPDTMLGFYFEGEYYEEMGEPKKALRTFEKAFGMQEIDFLTKEMALEKMDALKADFGF